MSLVKQLHRSKKQMFLVVETSTPKVGLLVTPTIRKIFLTHLFTSCLFKQKYPSLNKLKEINNLLTQIDSEGERHDS